MRGWINAGPASGVSPAIASRLSFCTAGGLAWVEDMVIGNRQVKARDRTTAGRRMAGPGSLDGRLGGTEKHRALGIVHRFAFDPLVPGIGALRGRARSDAGMPAAHGGIG